MSQTSLRKIVNFIGFYIASIAAEPYGPLYCGQLEQEMSQALKCNTVNNIEMDASLKIWGAYCVKVKTSTGELFSIDEKEWNISGDFDKVLKALAIEMNDSLREFSSNTEQLELTGT